MARSPPTVGGVQDFRRAGGDLIPSPDRAGHTARSPSSSAHSELRQAIDGSRSALELLGQQQEVVQEATGAWESALESISDTGGLEVAATAIRDLTFEYAGSGVTAEEAADKQQRLYQSFLDVAEGAGYTEEEARKAAGALGLIPEETLAYIVAEAQQFFDTSADVESDLDRLEREYFLTLSAIDDASLTANEVQGKVLAYVRRYEATLAADDQASRDIENTTDKADDFEGTRTATLDVDGNATRELSLIQEYLDRMPSRKTITVSTITRTSGGSTVRYQADGGILGVRRFAEGGLGGVQERPGTASIYQPAAPFRIFAEPETGGEAYIPLAPGKRDRSMAILRETARIMGAEVTDARRMAAGGILSRYAGGGISTKVIKFAAGGIDVPNGHRAGIHNTVRVFAEPETQGEAYIPLANDWRRANALEVWRQTGAALGQRFAAGGMNLPAVASWRRG